MEKPIPTNDLLAPLPGTPLTPEIVEGELRIKDIDLAARLEFARPRKIRDMIRRYMTDLERMGTCPAVGRVVNGGDAVEFFLNKRQAIFITAKSETAKATETTIEIIERFDAYERGAAPATVDPMAMLNDPAAMRGLLLSYTEKVLALQAANAALVPKADALDRIANADGSFSLQEAAKALQVRPKDLNTFLAGNGWIYRRVGSGKWLGYSSRTNSGDLRHVVTTKTQADGEERAFEQVKVTAQGLAKLAKLMPNRLAIAA